MEGGFGPAKTFGMAPPMASLLYSFGSLKLLAGRQNSMHPVKFCSDVSKSELSAQSDHI